MFNVFDHSCRRRKLIMFGNMRSIWVGLSNLCIRCYLWFTLLHSSLVAIPLILFVRVWWELPCPRVDLKALWRWRCGRWERHWIHSQAWHHQHWRPPSNRHGEALWNPKRLLAGGMQQPSHLLRRTTWRGSASSCAWRVERFGRTPEGRIGGCFQLDF